VHKDGRSTAQYVQGVAGLAPTDAIHAIATGITGTAAIAADQVRHRAAHDG
jgi:hypothetical protein